MNTGHATLGETLWTLPCAYYFGGYIFARFYR
jgi:hypothetical protein